MSTFLELVRDTARQSGTLAGGTTLSSVTSVTGRADKLVEWVKSAWVDIQNQRDWLFLQTEFTDALTIGTKRYTSASFNLTRFKKWAQDTETFRYFTIYDPAEGVDDESELRQIPYQTWQRSYDRGSHDSNRPSVWAISPANDFCVGPTPDKAYVLRGTYHKSAQVLAANTDEPEIPGHLHDIIVHRAMELMAEGDESPITYQFSNREYRRMFRTLCDEQLPSIGFGGALA